MPTSFGQVAHHLDDVVDLVSLKIVVFVETRNPAFRAGLIALTATSQRPG